MNLTRAAVGLALTLSLCAAPLSGCSSGNKKRAREVTPTLSGAPSVLRGTVGYETSLRQADSAYISGYGLVVGLNGTGSTNVPENIAATMEREILIMSGGEAGGFINTPLEGLSPREVIRHPDTAVVLVEGAIPPGAPEGPYFDVRVRALSGSTAESLEGGTLWTTRLQLGPASTLGGLQTKTIAEARGEVFINPFAEPGRPSEISCQAAMGLGTLLGGWKIVHTMGSKITRLTPAQGFCAETGGAITLFMATHLGVPVSTTHTITGAIVGVGASRRLSAVRWNVASRIVIAWVVTLPAAAVIGALFYGLTQLF